MKVLPRMNIQPMKRSVDVLISKSVLGIKTRLVVTVDLGTKWMPNSDSASNFVPEYKLLGHYGLPNSSYGYLKSPDFFKDYMDFPYKNKSRGNVLPPSSFLYGEAI